MNAAAAHAADPARATNAAALAAAAHGGGDAFVALDEETLEPLAPGVDLAEVLAAPLGQRLVAIYLATRGDELEPEVREALARRLGAIAGTGSLAGAEHLATDAYRRADWDGAVRFAALAPGAPRARWVQAKLALRDGDRAAADAHLAAAIAGLTGHERDRVLGERAALALADGRVTDAMALAWENRARYPDAVYLAERVLTIDELTAFVARVAPAPAAPPDRCCTWGEVTPWLLRDVLGRRLMRAGRFDEAQAYLSPDVQLAAWRYAGAIARARPLAGDPIDRAAAYHEASLIARRDGLELLGTSHAPDWGLWHASFDLSGWRPTLDDARNAGWHTAAEAARVRAHAPAPDRRYHYRFVASDLAERAADLLPRRSQAFAVTLCRAARHVRFRDDERVQALYQRWIDEGPMYSMSFGDDCPAPEFERARRFLPPPDEPRWPYGLLGAACLLAAALLVRNLRPGRVAARP